MLNTIILIQLVTLFFLLISSAIISGAEVAFFSISSTQLDSIQDNYPKEKGLIEKLLKKLFIFELLSIIFFEKSVNILYLFPNL